MEITEVRVKLVKDTSDQLKAFCSITFDGLFVIRDLKVIERRTGFFVAMPSRKVSDRCPKCRYKNHIRARFCNECGAELQSSRAGRVKLYVDVAHPINSECRQLIQQRVIEAFQEEFERSKEPGYVGQDYDETNGEELQTAAGDDPRDDREHTGSTARMDSTDDARDDDTNDKAGGSEYDELIRSLKSDAQSRRDSRDGSAKPVHRSTSPVGSRFDKPASADSLTDEEPADEEPATDERSAPEPKPTPTNEPTDQPARVAEAPIAPKPEPAPPREAVRPEPPARPSVPTGPSSFGEGLGFGEGLDVEEPSPAPSVEAPPEDQPAADPSAEVVPSHAESTEDDSGFGAGIL